MKIAFLSRYFGKSNRGAEVYVAELSKRLMTLGHSVTIHKDISDNIDPQTQIIISTNGRLDVIKAKLWTIFHKAKLIVSGQSGPGIDDKINLWSFPDVFIGLTAYQTNWAKSITTLVRTETIPNGVDLKKFSSTKKGIKIDLPGPIILCVAALVSIKRLHLLIKAVSQTTASLVLVGKGDQEEELLELGERLLPQRFKIMHLNHNEIPSVYAASDLFAFPTSPWESFGIVLVEAMASGLGIVATNDPIRKEIIGEAGILVDPVDTDKFSAALQKALINDWKDIPLKQAKKFSWDEIALQYDKLFKTL